MVIDDQRIALVSCAPSGWRASGEGTLTEESQRASRYLIQQLGKRPFS
jgi:hypothetical protein